MLDRAGSVTRYTAIGNVTTMRRAPRGKAVAVTRRPQKEGMKVPGNGGRGPVAGWSMMLRGRKERYQKS